MHIFSQLKREKSILGIRWENTALGTGSARNFFAIISPLQLGVVIFSSFYPPYTLYRLKGVISLFHETPFSHFLTFCRHPPPPSRCDILFEQPLCYLSVYRVAISPQPISIPSISPMCISPDLYSGIIVPWVL